MQIIRNQVTCMTRKSSLPLFGVWRRNSMSGGEPQLTERAALMTEVDFLLDCAKHQQDVGLACEMALAAQRRLNAIKTIDRMNDAFSSYKERRRGG
jgi:hypothetical protein